MADSSQSGRPGLTTRQRRLITKGKHLDVISGSGERKKPVAPPATAPQEQGSPTISTTELLTKLTQGIAVSLERLTVLSRQMNELSDKLDSVSEEIEFLAQVVLVPPPQEDHLQVSPEAQEVP